MHSWFNVDYLQESLSRRCPRLRVQSCEDGPGIVARVVDMPVRDYREPPYHNSTFRNTVLATVSSNLSIGAGASDISTTKPVLVRFGDSHIAWDYRAAGELQTMRKELFDIFRYNQTTLDMGQELISKSTSEDLKDGNYIAVHFRCEYDWPPRWGSVDDQMRLFVNEILRVNAGRPDPVHTVYISCGDPTPIQRFREALGPLGYFVQDKWALLFVTIP